MNVHVDSFKVDVINILPWTTIEMLKQHINNSGYITSNVWDIRLMLNNITDVV